MKSRLFCFLVLCLFWASPSLGLTGKEIAWKVFLRPVGKDSQSSCRMLLINKEEKKRERRLTIYSMEDDKARYNFVRFLAPKDIAGTGFLIISYHDGREEQFLYLPALKRTRRVAGSFRFHRFVNSDFIYEDFERHHPDKYFYKLLGEEEYAGQTCYVVKSWPKNKKMSAYSYWVEWITKEFLIIRIDYYDRKGRLWKRFKANKWQRIQGYLTLLDFQMEDLLKKHRTQVLVDTIVYDQGLDPQIFTRRNLERW